MTTPPAHEPDLAEAAVQGATLTAADADHYVIEDARDRGHRTCLTHIPARYQAATVQHPELAAWVRALVEQVRAERRTVPRIVSGPSLLIVGATGTGKTFAGFGAIRALCASGAGCAWYAITAADLYARLRPRHKVDSEDEFDRVARAGVLMLDDLGAAKPSEWTEEIDYRLVNYRYERHMPTLITSNVPPAQLADRLGERVASRLAEMATRVVLRGPDRRLTSKAGAA